MVNWLRNNISLTSLLVLSIIISFYSYVKAEIYGRHQVVISEAAEHGYIEGVLENGPNQTLLLAFKLPGTTKKSPPVMMTSKYSGRELPLKSLRFKVFNSSIMTMMLYSTFEKCVEATME